jgi:hypothetical protein
MLSADIANFTTICEGPEPAPLIAWLERYIDTAAFGVLPLMVRPGRSSPFAPGCGRRPTYRQVRRSA